MAAEAGVVAASAEVVTAAAEVVDQVLGALAAVVMTAAALTVVDRAVAGKPPHGLAVQAIAPSAPFAIVVVFRS